MKNLFRISKHKERLLCNKRLRDYIEISYKIASNKIDPSKPQTFKLTDREKFQNYRKIHEKTNEKNNEFQKKINQHTNLQAYSAHRNDPDKLFTKKINSLYSHFGDLLDSTEKDFTATIPDNYQQKLFELIMAELLNKNSKPNKRVANTKGESDLEFSHQSKNYFLECTTRNSSLMDVYVKYLANFDRNLKIAKIFQLCQKTLVENGEHGWEANWSSMLEQLWYRLQKKQQHIIIKLLSEDSKIDINELKSRHIPYPKLLLVDFDKWISIIQYAWFYFKNILPKTLKGKMRVIVPSCRSDDMPELAKFFVESISRMIVRKLDKLYFEKNTPVILALSLATLPDFMSVVPAFRQFELMAQSVAVDLRNNIHNYIEDTQDLNRVQKNLNSLYGIIIDTTWYNWFPEIVEQLHGAKWSDPECKNCYIVIYNTGISNEIKNDRHIFSSIIKNSIDLELT